MTTNREKAWKEYKADMDRCKNTQTPCSIIEIESCVEHEDDEATFKAGWDAKPDHCKVCHREIKQLEKRLYEKCDEADKAHKLFDGMLSFIIKNDLMKAYRDFSRGRKVSSLWGLQMQEKSIVYMHWLRDYLKKERGIDWDSLDWNEMCNITFRFGDVEHASNNAWDAAEKGFNKRLKKEIEDTTRFVETHHHCGGCKCQKNQ